jgi:CheY-like chemotaxis protein
MAPDVIERAFDPFFTTKPLGQGTGLGLSMVYGFVRQSGGQITIESRPETGTSVIILLPRFEGDRLAEVASNQASEHTAEPGQSILVVEDEIMVRDLIVAHLKELGYRIVTAVDGPSGLHTLQSSQRIDLLLTDIGLPGLNGRQIADAARVSRPKLPVLFMTGYADTAVVRQGGLDEGMSIITKPFDFDDLGVRVREMLSHT